MKLIVTCALGYVLSKKGILDQVSRGGYSHLRGRAGGGGGKTTVQFSFFTIPCMYLYSLPDTGFNGRVAHFR